MKQLFTMSFLCCAFSLFAQLPPPCPSNSTTAADTLSQACIYCNLSGFQSSTAGYTADNIQGYCGTSENGQFLGFIAGETTVSLTLISTNSQNSDGLDAALLSADGQVIACNAGQSGGATTPLTLSATNMTVGDTYYLFVDGYNGDICDFTITGNPPSALTPPIPVAPTSFSGSTNTCPNATVEYSIPAIQGASAYTWVAPSDALINGMSPPATILGDTGHTVTISFGNASGVICVNGVNSCFTGPPLCQPVVIAPIPPTQLPDTTICFGDTLLSTGIYDTTYITAAGCDSTVRQFVFVKIPIPTVLPPTTLCPGDSLPICDSMYFEQGNYQALCDGALCDSIVNFTIIIPSIDVNISSSASTTCPNFPVILSYDPNPGSPIWYKLGNPIPIGNAPTHPIIALGTYVLASEFTVGSGTCTAYDTISFSCPLTTPCPSNFVLPTDNCADACVYCDFNGLQSSTGAYTADTLSSNLILENGQFLGFIAGESSATFTAIPSNCQNGDGIEIGLIADCTDVPLGTTMDSLGGGTVPVSISVNNLIVGANYFLFVDGKNGDDCAFTVVVSPPNAIAAPMPAAPTNLIGSNSVCPNTLEVYSTPPIAGASAYTWTAPPGALINGNPTPQTVLASDMGNIVTIEFADEEGTICVNGVNSCLVGDDLCMPISFNNSFTLTEDTTICEGAAIPMPFDTTYVTADGCDSVVQFVTIIMNTQTMLPPQTICRGDTLQVCDELYWTSGNYSTVCTGFSGCDSIVSFTLNVPNFAEIVQGDSVECPTLPFPITYAPAPGIPSWRKLGDTTVLSNNLSYSATELGTYIFDLEYLIASGFCTESDTIVLFCTVAVDDLDLEKKQLTVHPNISADLFTLRAVGDKEMSSLRVFDMQGRLVQHETIEQHQYVLNASTLQSGTYILSVLIDGQWVQRRIVKL